MYEICMTDKDKYVVANKGAFKGCPVLENVKIQFFLLKELVFRI